jgi:hypothetical protein
MADRLRGNEDRKHGQFLINRLIDEMTETEGGRIGAMAGFTIAFALVLAVFTNARRLEIAASRAA